MVFRCSDVSTYFHFLVLLYYHISKQLLTCNFVFEQNKLEVELQKVLEDKKRIMSESSEKDAEIMRLKVRADNRERCLRTTTVVGTVLFLGATKHLYT